MKMDIIENICEENTIKNIGKFIGNFHIIFFKFFKFAVFQLLDLI